MRVSFILFVILGIWGIIIMLAIELLVGFVEELRGGVSELNK